MYPTYGKYPLILPIICSHLSQNKLLGYRLQSSAPLLSPLVRAKNSSLYGCCVRKLKEL